jgi:hypothetical protein
MCAPGLVLFSSNFSWRARSAGEIAQPVTAMVEQMHMQLHIVARSIAFEFIDVAN